MSMRVGVSLKRYERWRNDKEYKEKKKAYSKIYQIKNKKKIREYMDNYNEQLNIFADKHCIVCNKLLDYRTKSKFCQLHWRKKDD